MVRITRLHVLLLVIGFVGLVGALKWMKVKDKPVEPAPSPVPAAFTEGAPAQEAADPADRLKREAARTAANVGALYQPLRKKYGDIPAVSQPLRTAKAQLAQGQHEQALASARIAGQAIKAFGGKIDKAGTLYQVARGDTLWTIAAAYSPVRAGAGWVAIWKANKDLVTNFDRLEVGWTLAIPPQKADYVMPFWKPH
jgi:nucleoid-associated protein YgaU